MSTFLFVLMLAVSVSVTAVSLHEIKCDLSDKAEHGKRLKNIQNPNDRTKPVSLYKGIAKPVIF